MPVADLLQVVEAAYHLEVADRAWLQGLTNAVGPLIDDGYGVYGTRIDASNPRQMRLGEIVSYRGQPVFLDAILKTNAALTAQEVKLTYRRVAAIETATERGVTRWRELADQNGPPGIGDCAAVLAANTRGVGCMVLAPLHEPHRYSQRVKRVWARVVAHVIAMQRLRDNLPTATAAVRAEGEAVLSPGGQVEHAVGPAQSKSARALLRAAAIARERARGRLRRQDPDEAVEIWQALVAGRWSIVDRFDRDGRRFLIAHQNEPEAAELHALTPRERQVVSQVAAGHSNKLIAYTLGLSVGAVSGYLNLAMKKLGLHSRMDLARLLLAARPR